MHIHPSDAFSETLEQWGSRPEFRHISGELRAAEDLCVTEVLAQLAELFGRNNDQSLLGDMNDLCRYTQCLSNFAVPLVPGPWSWVNQVINLP